MLQRLDTNKIWGNKKNMKRKYKGRFEPAISRKIGELLSKENYKFIGSNTNNLRLKLNLMSNMSLVIA